MTEIQTTYQAKSTGWRNTLSERQRNELELARFYVHELDHGTVGHHRLYLTLIDNLADLLDACGTDAPVPQPVLKFHILDVPYHSQHEADAKKFRKDCGPACVEMIGEWIGEHGADATTDEIMKWITAGGGDRGIWIKELQAAAKHFYDIALKRHDGATWDNLWKWVTKGKRPIIVLIHYGSFATRMDRNYRAGHYLVVVGFDEIQYQDVTIERIIIHDPDFYGVGLEAQGAFVPVTKAHFMRMWGDCHKDRNPNHMALIPLEDS